MFILCSAPLLLGMVFGLAGGGTLGGLLALSIRRLWLVWVAFLCQIISYYVPTVGTRLRAPLLLVVFALVGIWLVGNLPGRNSHVRLAIGVLLAGGLLNGLVIFSNGGRMPVSPPAALSVGHAEAGVGDPGARAFYEPADDSTVLRPLGDVIPLGSPVSKVVSVGDVVLLAGIALFVAAAMRPQAVS